MKKQRFSVEQITSVLQQVAGGIAVGEACRQIGISEQTFYGWKKDYGGMATFVPRRAITEPSRGPSQGPLSHAS